MSTHRPVPRAAQMYIGQKIAYEGGGNIGFCWRTKHGTSGEASFVWQTVSDL